MFIKERNLPRGLARQKSCIKKKLVNDFKSKNRGFISNYSKYNFTKIELEVFVDFFY